MSRSPGVLDGEAAAVPLTLSPTVKAPVGAAGETFTLSYCGPSPSVVVDVAKARDAAGCDVLIVVGDGQRVGRLTAQGVAVAGGEGQDDRLSVLGDAVVIDGNRDDRATSPAPYRHRTGVLDSEVVAAARRRRLAA